MYSTILDLQNIPKLNHRSIMVESSAENHFDWCQEITSLLPIEAFPRILHENVDYHEVMVFFTPNIHECLGQDMIVQIKQIIWNRPETSNATFYKPSDKEFLLAHFLVKHSLKNTITSVLGSRINSDRFSPDVFIVEAAKGIEQWFFRGTTDTIAKIEEKVQSVLFGKIDHISNELFITNQINYYKHFFHLLGANPIQSKILSYAKFYSLLSDFNNIKKRKTVYDNLGYNENLILYNLNRGIMKCSWIHSALQALREPKFSQSPVRISN